MRFRFYPLTILSCIVMWNILLNGCAGPANTVEMRSDLPVMDDSLEADRYADDISPPQIILMTGSGNTISAEPGTMITVKGYVMDDGRITDFHVDDEHFQLPEDGTFALIKKVGPGKNMVMLEAIDEGLNRTEAILTILGMEQNEESLDELAPEKRLALVIGNGAYKYAAKLSNPGNDAVDIARRLKTLGFDVIRVKNVRLDKMKREIDEFGRRLKDYDVGLFFYAGHGAQAGGVNYLFPVDANPEGEDDVEFHCVEMNRVIARMESAGSKTNIIILDACRDNPFDRAWSRSSRGRGLASVTAPRGTYIAYATAPGSTAHDGFGRNGIYTAALLRTIGTPDIPIEDVFKVVRSMVLNASNGKQLTWDASSLIGTFTFNPQGRFKVSR